MSTIIQNAIVVIGLFVLAGLGYYLYVENSRADLDTSSSITANQASIESANFLRLLAELREIELNVSIFSDSRFQSLRDNTPDVVEVPVGRENPYEETE